MATNDTKVRKPLSMSDMPKSIVYEALKSAKVTRAKVRERIKNGTLKEVPTEISDFLDGKVA